MIVLDTRVLVYAVGADHPMAGPCERIIKAAGEGHLSATTTTEVIQEFAHVRARRRSRREAASLARTYAELFAPLIVIDDRILASGLRLFEASRKLGAFDAVLAAAAIAVDADAIVSADGSFAEVPGIAWWGPSTPDILRLLGSDGDQK